MKKVEKKAEKKTEKAAGKTEKVMLPPILTLAARDVMPELRVARVASSPYAPTPNAPFS